MPEFALIDAAGAILEYRILTAQPTPAKGRRWLPVTRASVDAATEMAVAPAQPIAAEATVVAWTKAADEAKVAVAAATALRDIIRRRHVASVEEQARKLDRGSVADQLRALRLRETIRNG